VYSANTFAGESVD